MNFGSKNRKMEAVKIKETFDFLYLNQRLLTVGQMDFIQSLKKYFTKNKQLSEKQAATLFKIKKYLQVDEPVRITNKLEV